MAALSLLDAVLLLPLLIFLFKGLQNGLMKEAFGLAGIVVSVFLAFRYMETVTSILSSFLPEYELLLPILSAILIFIIIMTLANLLGFVLKKALSAAQIGIIDRILGAAFGMVKVGLLLSAILIFLAGFNMPSEKSRQNSVLYPYVIQIAPVTFNAVATVYPGAEDFDETIQKTIKDYNPLNNW